MLVCGVDEAGRGSMLGPLVVAGVAMDNSKLRRLRALGVRDSKRLSPKKRSMLYREILDLADRYRIIRVQPRSIDASVRMHRLNILEARYMARVIKQLNPEISYVDSCDVNPRRFGDAISAMSGHARIRSYHHADDRFAIVSAASILAKVARDAVISGLRASHDLGSGYPSDSVTVGFVTRYYEANRSLPAFVRSSWRPVQRIMASPCMRQ